jgi:DNA-binding transcriptional LysR family regulator
MARNNYSDLLAFVDVVREESFTQAAARYFYLRDKPRY